jgi:predicted solute-binding protein
VATRNVRAITNKEDKLELELLSRKIDIAVISETKTKTKKKNKGSK